MDLTCKVELESDAFIEQRSEEVLLHKFVGEKQAGKSQREANQKRSEKHHLERG